MSLNSVLALAAATFSAALAVAAACRGRRSLATWCFSAGMLTFALESFFGAMWHDALVPERAAFWETLTLVTKSFLPGIWLCFSLTYSRGNSREFPAKSRFLVLMAFLVPVGVSLVFRDQLAPIFPQNESGGNWWISSHAAPKTLNGLLLVAAVLLLSNRIRQNIQCFVSRHFKRPQYDFRQIWTRFTQSTSRVLDQFGLCVAAAKFISETFNVLSVTIWLFDEQEQLAFAASTSRSEREANDAVPNLSGLGANLTSIRGLSKPFDLEKAKGDYAESLRQISSSQFRTGGNRVCTPFWTGDRCIGMAILADRVGGVPYTVEELDLLRCMGDQIAVGLLNLRLTEEIMRGKELEAFQAMSAFFVHDLKNAASTLSLTLQNLPVHFDDPVFRQDALRGIGETASRINQLISRLGALRPLELKPVEADVNLLVADALEVLNGAPEINVVKELRLQPKLKVDCDQFRSVITNLLLNARDALGPRGEITIETRQRDSWAILSVADNGCGMSPGFVKASLFRRSQTTHKKGLGIGMFQSKMIAQAHRAT